MNDYESNYVELPEKSRNSATETMQVVRTLTLEI